MSLTTYGHNDIVYFNINDILRLILLIGTLLLPACANRQFVLELGAGYDAHVSVGRPFQSVGRLRSEPAQCRSGWVYEYTHHSGILDGYPFNDRDDDLVNQYSAIYRWVF